MSTNRIPRAFRPYIDAALAAGWTLTYTSKNHPRLLPPPGLIDTARGGGLASGITMSSSPNSEHAALRGLASDLKKFGIVPSTDRKGKR